MGYLVLIIFAVIIGRSISQQFEHWIAEPPPSPPVETITPAPPSGAVMEEIRGRSRSLGMFHPSFYQIVDESDREFRGKPGRMSVLDRRGRRIGWVSEEYYERLTMEGAGKLADGRIVTFDTRVGGVIRFRTTDAPYGLSHRETPLVPFRTVAVDANVIPLGSVIYVPSVVGLPLPDGTEHDGIFVADDIGRDIRGQRIDVFVGFEDHIRNSFSRSGMIRHYQPIEVYLVPRELAHGLVNAYRIPIDDR